jgi:hypothetical protein
MWVDGFVLGCFSGLGSGLLLGCDFKEIKRLENGEMLLLLQYTR